jgi:CheY-like chemotaxis protein
LIERQLAEQALRESEHAEQRARSEADEANRVKDDFLATLSHELRTPLNAMLGWLRMLRTHTLDEATVGRVLEVIERNVNHQTRLITDLLDINRITSGKLTLEMTVIDWTPIVAGALEAIRPAAEARAITIIPDLHAGGVPVVGNPERLRQVVASLLSNALKFTPNGGRVSVRLERVSDCVRLSVMDTGKGISDTFLPFIFERFRQADAGSTRAEAGLGLGLAIVRHIVELHQGRVDAYSAGEGKGAIFTVDLPIATPGQDCDVDTISGHDMTGEVVLTGVRVLIIDDDGDSRDLLTAILTLRDAQVTAVETVREALAAMRHARPDVILCDLAMPGDDGFALIRQVRSWPRDQGGEVPALALTAYARLEDSERALAAGFQLHLSKPVEPRDVVEAVARLAGSLDVVAVDVTAARGPAKPAPARDRRRSRRRS